jgi:2-polyprenyl-3-methyl-5-hydroxy-6-metoxy-1,4-benzoquinol methylase
LSCGLVSLSSFDHIEPNFYENSLMNANPPCPADIINTVGNEDDVRRYHDFLDFFVGKRILDIGCGNGQLLALMRAVATEAVGVEPDRRWREHHEQLGISVHSTLPEGETAFDTITMFHLLEHIPDPLPYLTRLRALLREEGRLIIEVPNAQDALLTLYENKPFSEFTYWSPHLFLHTPETLQTLLEKAGFHTVEVRQFQRYPLANHLYWLAKGKPGGQVHWGGLRNPAMECLYAETLAKLGKCDTLIGLFSAC